MKTLTVISCFLALGRTEKVRYDDFKLYRVIPQDESQVNALRKLDLDPDYNFWSSPSKPQNPVDIAVPPKLNQQFQNVLRKQHLNYTMLMSDIEEVIQENEFKSRKSGRFGFTSYHNLDEIYDYLEETAKEYPNIVKLVVGGKTYEGRDILGVHISFDRNNEDRAVFLEGGIHAREWLAPATVMYLMTALLTSDDEDVRAMATSHDWYIFPSFNPDGYAYTHSTDRFWRKSRKPNGWCYGADLNRNWGHHWMDGGSSMNPCYQTFAGTSAFSEIETKSMSKYISSIGRKLIAYIAFHCYSQMLLIPYGYTSKKISNYNDLYSIGVKAMSNLEKLYGTNYTVGNIVDIIYVASGSSMDWVKATFDTPITYTLELRDLGQYGFLLPASQIIPTGEETLEALLTILTEFDKIL